MSNCKMQSLDTLETDANKNEKEVPTIHNKPVYTIEIDCENNVNVCGIDGARCKSDELNLPISLGENAELVSVISANFWEVKGSHYIISQQAGRWIKYYLPH
ncbi:MAG: hypothetical protein KAH20_08430 [Methylococcales bacterium]|nr:hypothetical protein [Methylococcales bacterium]